MYQALYRKWRPRTFDDVVGQEQVTDTLKSQIINDRLSHAYLFVGTRGTGKTTCAKILARAANCEQPENGNPCNKCKSCLGIEDGSVLDVVELDAASNNGVDNVRALRDEAVYSPVSVKKRVYIIDEVHMLSTSAFNALLKILEEPPEHLMFILATTELQKVPATILSRCQRHSFRRIKPEKVAERLQYVAQREGLELEPNAGELLSRLADGSLRDGLSLLDQCSGNPHITAEGVLSSMGLAGNMRTIALLEAVSKSDTEAALSVFSSMWSDGKAPATLLTELCALLRDILMLKVAPKGAAELLSGGFDLETLKTFAGKMSAEELISHIDAVQTRVGALRDGRDPKTAAELCIIGLCEQELGDNIDCLRARVKRLEEGGAKINAAASEQKMREDTKATPKKTEQAASTEASERYDDDRPPFDLYDEPPVSSQDTPALELETPKKDAQPRSEPEAIASENGAEAAQPAEPEKQSVSAGGDTAAWSAIYAELQKTMAVPQFVHIKSAQGELLDDSLTIAVKSAFQQTQLEQPGPQELIRAALEKTTGRALPVKIVVGKAAENDGGKLNDLSKFNNVKFE